ncbi:hypothetical protein Tco_0350141, partial [Tanacetum coccineum]
ALKPLEGLAVGANKLSPTSNLEPRAIHNLFRGSKVTSGASARLLVEVRNKGGDGVGRGIGKRGSVPDGGVFGGGKGDTGSGGDGICGSGDDSEVSKDGGVVGKERSLSTFALGGSGIGV